MYRVCSGSSSGADQPSHSSPPPKPAPPSPTPAPALPRQAEIKHGRVAMAAFVGFIVQSNGIHFPWDLTTSGISHADIAAAGGPAAQWDALPTASKLQAHVT